MWPKKRQVTQPKPPQPKRIADMYVPNTPARPAPSPLRVSHTGLKKPEYQTQSHVPNRPSTVKRSDTDMQPPTAKFWLGLLLLIVVLGGASGAAYYFLKYKPNHKPQPSQAVKVVDNTNHITDDPNGLKFAISKDFTTIASADLVKQNPNFVYGFKQTDVNDVSCIISQQKRTSGGAVAPTALRDGTLKSIQKAFPDAKLIDYQDISLNNGQDAASLVMTYTDNKVAKKEKMIVVATDPRVTFVFCSSPTPLFDFYSAKFQPFFDSLEVY